MKLDLRLRLLSDATFGRGEGVAGLVDEEVEYDTETGLPFIRGRTLKGLLVEECANILFALREQTTQQRQSEAALDRLETAAQFLFGRAGSTLADDAEMHVGAARLPEELCRVVAAGIARNKLQSAEVLESLTAVRRQTAVSDETGAPDEGSLRSMRVVLRETTFRAPLEFTRAPEDAACGLLGACVKALRRGGTGRNRGRGRLEATLYQNGEDVTAAYFAHFQRLVRGGQA